MTGSRHPEAPSGELGRLVACALGIAPEDLRPEARLGEPPWTSLAHIALLAAVAQDRGFTLTAEHVQTLTSLEAITAFVGEQEKR